MRWLKTCRVHSECGVGCVDGCTSVRLLLRCVVDDVMTGEDIDVGTRGTKGSVKDVLMSFLACVGPCEIHRHVAGVLVCPEASWNEMKS